MTAAGGQPSGVRSHPSPVSGPALVLAAAVLWGTVGIASRLLYGIEDIPPLVVGFFRLALAVPLLGLWCWWRLGPETFRFDGSDRLRIAGIGLTMAAYQACYFQAVADVGVALATLITICSAPVSTAEQKSAIRRRKSRPLGAASGERREGVARPEFPASSVGDLTGERWRFFVPGFGQGDSCRHSSRGC